MDIAWYIARWALPLNVLTGHRPPPDERQYEREVCLRIARGEEVDSEDLDVAYPAACGAWGGGLMVSILLSALFLALEDHVHQVFRVPGFVFLLAMGLCLGLFLICHCRDWLLDRADLADAGTWTERIATRFSRPRAYDIVLAAAGSVWPALWGAGVV
ncbi:MULTISPECIES: hypothetical protein [Streptomyces]|uniref:hypothetical protein n=1 Tax=Streptomyces TaxID=1883 RepID=UPI0005B8A3E2|nr:MULTISPECIES: hypothetical protein [Streptomyces]MDP9949068.1 hypothetical protein [Streptomyces sp. DSM 41269]